MAARFELTPAIADQFYIRIECDVIIVALVFKVFRDAAVFNEPRECFRLFFFTDIIKQRLDLFQDIINAFEIIFFGKIFNKRSELFFCEMTIVNVFFFQVLIYSILMIVVRQIDFRM